MGRRSCRFFLFSNEIIKSVVGGVEDGRSGKKKKKTAQRYILYLEIDNEWLADLGSRLMGTEVISTT